MTIRPHTPGARATLQLATLAVILAWGSLWHALLSAQAQPQPDASGLDLSQVVASATPGEEAVFTYNNRPITVLRAVVLSREPAERAAAAIRVLDLLVGSGRIGRVSTRSAFGATIVSVGERNVFAILPLDVDQLTGETMDGKAAAAAAQLQLALDEAVELRTPGLLLRSAGQALFVTLLAGALLWAAARLHARASGRLVRHAQQRLARTSAGDLLVKVSHAPDLLRHALRAVFAVVVLFLLYNWLTFVLRRFPYTRPWGESLRAFLTEQVTDLGLGIVSALPNLFKVLLILIVTRFIVRLIGTAFQAAAEGRLTIPYVYPETAQPTRRIVTAMVWLLALVAAYPYLPGSGSDAFKGVSVFVGLVISLGSSGIVNQMMSGLTIMYSRALRVGDFVKIGDVEGTVTHLGPLSTKVKTPRREEVTIPNAVVMGHVTTNYSRLAEAEGVYVATTLTIGYDAPWRQIHALLLMAAERTPGIRSSPKPVVRQTSLQDFYVQYTLLVCLEQPSMRPLVLDALHGNIQDAFNEYGVQIMSPNYEADPEGRKIVPPDQWYAAPAQPPAARERV